MCRTHWEVLQVNALCVITNEEKYVSIFSFASNDTPEKVQEIIRVGEPGRKCLVRLPVIYLGLGWKVTSGVRGGVKEKDHDG